MMDWSVIQNPYVIGGGLIVGLFIIVSRGSSVGAGGGPSWTDVSEANTRAASVSLEFAKTENARQIEALKLQTSFGAAIYNADAKRAMVRDEMNAKIEQSRIGALSAVQLSSQEARARVTITQIQSDRDMAVANTMADAQKYSAKKAAQASVWNGAFDFAGRLVGAGEKAAQFAMGLPPVPKG